MGGKEVNRRVLKDAKTILAFTIAFALEIIGIVLAAKNEDGWVVFVIFGMLLTFYGVNRANRLYKEN